MLSISVKLWNKNATAVTDNQEGCTLSVTNASVDRYNQHTHMNTNELTTVQVIKCIYRIELPLFILYIYRLNLINCDLRHLRSHCTGLSNHMCQSV